MHSVVEPMVMLPQVYALSKLKRLFRMVTMMMEDTLRFVAIDCLSTYCKYIETACSQMYAAPAWCTARVALAGNVGGDVCRGVVCCHTDSVLVESPTSIRHINVGTEAGGAPRKAPLFAVDIGFVTVRVKVRWCCDATAVDVAVTTCVVRRVEVCSMRA
jgi:hypothetical protein